MTTGHSHACPTCHRAWWHDVGGCWFADRAYCPSCLEEEPSADPLAAFTPQEQARVRYMRWLYQRGRLVG